VIDPDWQYRLALDRGESLREEAARERMAGLATQSDRHGSVTFRTFLGTLLIRAGRALGGDRSSGNAMASRIVGRGSLDEGRHPTRPVSDNGTWVVSLTGAPLSRSPSTSAPGLSAAWMARSVPRDGLDRLLRDLDRLARDSAPGELRER
jgi:hypothetical protein